MKGHVMIDARPSSWLEALAAFCLSAPADDCRLGDLSELHVRTRAEIRASLDGVPGSAVVARLAADARYIAATVDVMVFARGVDPGLQLYENGVDALVALNLREKAMAMLHFSVRRFALPALLLACSALMLNNAVDGWSAWRQAESLMVSAQREKAETAARGLVSLRGELNRVLSWAAYWFVRQPADQRHYDNVRMLLQQKPAILQLTQLDGQGRERLVMNQYSADVIGSETDRSADAAFVGVRSGGSYVGPVHADKHGDPAVTVGYAPRGTAAGVVIAEISLKPVRDIVAGVAPEGGSAYIVDGEGHRLFAADENSAGPIRSISADVPGTAWKVVVDVPSAVYDVPERNAAIRAVSTAGLALVAAALAFVLALRPAVPARPAAA
jgi:hypothetical protein